MSGEFNELCKLPDQSECGFTISSIIAHRCDANWSNKLQLAANEDRNGRARTHTSNESATLALTLAVSGARAATERDRLDTRMLLGFEHVSERADHFEPARKRPASDRKEAEAELESAEQPEHLVSLPVCGREKQVADSGRPLVQINGRQQL